MPAQPRRRLLVAAVLAVALVVMFARRVATFATDALWFSSIGYDDVFWSLIAVRVALALVAGLLVALLLAANVLLANRFAPTYLLVTEGEQEIERYRRVVQPHVRALAAVVAVLAGIVTALVASGAWEQVLLWANAVEFGRVDPQFGRDLGWFVFVLPLHSLVATWLFRVLVLTVLVTAAAHYLFGGVRPQAVDRRITPQASAHLSVLMAALVAVQGWRFLLGQYLLSYSARGEVTGLSYTDVHAQLPAYRLLVLVSAVVVVLFLLNVRARGWLLPSVGVGILLIAAVILGGIYPAVIQRLQVEPQELARERAYIERNLELTRFGFDLDDVAVRQFPARAALTPQDVDANRATLGSVRLWDPTTLRTVYEQLQRFKPYYDFRDVDVDRYEVDGETVQVLIGARELDEGDLPSPTWQNRRLFFTHGFGHVVSPVSGATGEGLPRFLVGDIPPEGAPEIAVANPRVYVGEQPPEYSIVGAEPDEFDFPSAGGDEEFRYDGRDGVDVGSPLRRLAFALRFAEPNFVLTGLIQPESKVLFRRHVRDRVASVAPFLKLDHDPYPVAAGDTIKWIVDAYTATDMLPYSERVALGPLTVVEERGTQLRRNERGELERVPVTVAFPALEGRANYLRNSVKAVVDAYDGTVTLYVADPDDPVLSAWQRAFPQVFTPLAEAPAEVRAHIRYPEDLFRVQSAVYTTYHMDSPGVFYSKEDAWAIPPDPGAQANNPERRNNLVPLRPYYLLLRLPGETAEEFVLIQPFTPRERANLIAWLAARSDPERYGELELFAMPPNRPVLGPALAQSKINQDEIVAEQTTLWHRAGSRVIYGNLLVIPVEDSLLYIQPLFLRAEQSEIPELKKVVVVFGESVVMEDTLAESLARIFGEGTEPEREPEGEREPGGAIADGRVAELIRQALEHFAEAERALRDGDLGAYQREVGVARELLEQAERATGARDGAEDRS